MFVIVIHQLAELLPQFLLFTVVPFQITQRQKRYTICQTS